MANIAPLPSGQDLKAKARVGARSYGPHLTTVIATNGTDLLLQYGTAYLARTDGAGYTVFLHNMGNPDHIPYVNKFIAGWGKVETYWRAKKAGKTGTDALRLVRTGGPLFDAKPTVHSAAPAVSGALDPTLTQSPSVYAEAQRVLEESLRQQEAEVQRLLDEQADAEANAERERIAEAEAVAAELERAAEAARKAKPGKDGLVHRTIDGEDVVIFRTGIVSPAKVWRTLTDALAARQAGDVAAVLLTGPSGTAKTMLVRAFADSVDLPLITVHGLAIETASDWFGQTVIKSDRSLEFVLSPFGEALRDGTPCIVLLDEANRCASPAALNAPLSLLDGQKQVYVPGYGNLTMPDNILVVVTANMGAEYVGTIPFDAAVRQRFSYGARLSYPSESVEVEVLRTVAGADKDTARRLVAMAAQQRPLRDDLAQFPSGTGLSTRMLVDVATRHVKRGTPLREALESLCDAQFDVEDMRALNVILDQHFPTEANATLGVDVNAINEDGF